MTTLNVWRLTHGGGYDKAEKTITVIIPPEHVKQKPMRWPEEFERVTAQKVRLKGTNVFIYQWNTGKRKNFMVEKIGLSIHQQNTWTIAGYGNEAHKPGEELPTTCSSKNSTFLINGKGVEKLAYDARNSYFYNQDKDGVIKGVGVHYYGLTNDLDRVCSMGAKDVQIMLKSMCNTIRDTPGEYITVVSPRYTAVYGGGEANIIYAHAFCVAQFRREDLDFIK